MVTISNLSLCIYGGTLNDGMDALPLVSVGNAPDEFQPMPPTIVDEQQSWMITHAQNYTLYALFSKDCHTAEGLPGQMMICLFFPVQKRLADGHSPLGLLDSLMDVFAIQSMQGDRLPGAPVDNSPFKRLLGRYRLEERPMLLPIMQGNEPAAFCVENKTQLDAIMRHSRYQSLSSVGRLELGYHCKSSIELTSRTKSSTPVVPPTPEPVVAPKIEKPKPPVQSAPEPEVISGGLSLDDDEPVVVKKTSWLKKLWRAILIIVGTIFGLFVLLGVIGLCMDDDDIYLDEPIEDTVLIDDDTQTEETPVINDDLEEISAKVQTEEAETRRVIYNDDPII